MRPGVRRQARSDDTKMDEPCNLRRCESNEGFQNGRLFTCGRPGRSLGSTASVPDEITECWVAGLPTADTVHVVSLLGSKNDGRSEYSFYSFKGSHEKSGKPTFQTWLDTRYGVGRFRVHEHPTTDAGPRSLSAEDLHLIRSIVMPLLSHGETVIVFDSYGAERTGQFCKAIGFRRK
jgi:hypothetical protein